MKLLKKLAQFIAPKSEFVPPTAVFELPVVQELPEPKPSLWKRILLGLPGAAASAASVMGAKAAAGACLKGLCLTSSPIALAAAGVAGSALLGGVTAQTVEHLRNRWNEAEKTAGHKISTRDLIKSFSVAAARRELGSLGQEMATKQFWKGAVKKGSIQAAFGAASGFALAHGLDWAKDLMAPKPPLAPLSPLPLTPAPAADLFDLPKEPLINTAPELPEVPAEPMPLNIETALDHARGHITEDSLAADMLARADHGNAQAIKDLAVGFNHGKFGVPLNKEIAQMLFEKAAALGNVQALQDLGRVAKAAQETAHAAVTEAAQTAQPAADADAFVPAGIDDETRARAQDAIRAAYGDAANAAPEPQPEAATPPAQPALPATPPSRIGTEAMRCVTQIQDGPVSRAVNSICSLWKGLVERGDSVLVGAPDAKPLSYTYDGDTPVPAETFMNDTLVNYATQPR